MQILIFTLEFPNHAKRRWWSYVWNCWWKWSIGWWKEIYINEKWIASKDEYVYKGNKCSVPHTMSEKHENSVYGSFNQVLLNTIASIVNFLTVNTEFWLNICWIFLSNSHGNITTSSGYGNPEEMRQSTIMQI